MAAKALNFKMDEAEIMDMKEVAGVFNITLTDLIKTAIGQYLKELKSDPFYRLTMYAQEASDEEAQEILSEIDALTADDLTIASSKRITV